MHNTARVIIIIRGRIMHNNMHNSKHSTTLVCILLTILLEYLKLICILLARSMHTTTLLVVYVSGRGIGPSAAFAHFRHSLPREQLNPRPKRREACRG